MWKYMEELIIHTELIVEAAKDHVKVEAQFVELMVPLYSYGCQNKIKKALAPFKGIYSVNVDYKQQKVSVWGICNKMEVLSAIRAKRKGACFWNHKQQQLDHDDDDDEISGSSQLQSHTAPPSPSNLTTTTSSSSNICLIKKGRRHHRNGHGRLLSALNWKKLLFNRSNSF